MTTATLVNATDTYVDSGTPTKNYNTLTSFYTRATPTQRYAFLYFGLNIPRGATILSAHLFLKQVGAGSGSQTADAALVGAKFDARKITWNNKPPGKGAVVAVTKTSPAAGTVWDFDLTAPIQTIADGGAWYGLRIWNANLRFYSAQHPTASFRPKLVVTWSDAPEAPDVLSPGGGRAISLDRPIVRTNFLDVGGDRTLQSIQVQCDAAGDFTTNIDWDSLEEPADSPQLDLSTALGTLAAGTTNQPFPAVAADAGMWWRARLRDGAGLWGAYSTPVQWIRKLKGTVTFVNPVGGVISDPTPPIAWSFGGNGRTQRAYEVLVVDASNPNVVLWTSGKTTSTDTSVTVKAGVITTIGSTYRIVVRIYDEQSRESIPGDPAYAQAVMDVTYTPTSSVAGVTGLTATSLYPKPWMQFDFSRASGDPDSFALIRDGVVVATFDPDDVRVSAGVYRLVDMFSTARKDHTWTIACVVNGSTSSSNPTYTGQVKMLAPWLMRTDGSSAITFLNPSKDGSLSDLSSVFQPVGEGVNPVLISQGVGGESGTFQGLLATEGGVDAETALAYLKSMRRNQGEILLFHYINQVMRVFCSNFDYQAVSYGSGKVDYLVKFSYWQVDYS